MHADEIRKPWLLNYTAVQRTIDDLPVEERAAFLLKELPPFWVEVYEENTGREVELYRLSSGEFQYIYEDHGALVASGRIEDDSVSESRLVAAFGRSEPASSSRAGDDSRLKGWVGPTEKCFGKGFDKGHFMAHSIGGAVDRAEFNVFVQCRRLNRGWTDDGRRYRSIENYCQSNPGVFCFSRPFYTDVSSRPSWLEFGVLRIDGSLWVENFDNRGAVE
ncbi:hypothetical protein KBB96_05110 [Luteolibacter ambystomatis]|uniref:DNA/RNA non-specific endonuclease n=1 Tax=Luteolibacter ambystomatis TaxID=2824561 RepID=A0A975PGG0_9BACT|nr:hypothetical protein [Luteolibacter ambystomatis]QUE52272.1 hypothetical protein KBB96_05110 [Luteolibacter ambystomatis]